MPNTAFVDAVAAYWKALAQPGSPPELTDSRLDAFVDLLHLTGSSKLAFCLSDLDDDPYLGMAVGDESKNWRTHWAIQVGELEAFESPRLKGLFFLVDTIADTDGYHRVYSLHKGSRGELEFRKISDLLKWMAADIAHAKKEISEADLQKIKSDVTCVLDDPWEDSPTSGWFVFEELHDAPLVEAWDAISRGQWPLVQGYPSEAPADREDGWQRRLSLWVAMHFLERRHVDLPPDVVVSDMDGVHRALVSHLYDFEQAIHSGEVPALVDQAAGDPSVDLGKLANQWIERHDAWRTAAIVPSPEGADDFDIDDEPVQFQHTPFTRKLMAALSTSLDSMVEKGELELDPDRKESLLIEMVTAGSDARSVKHMLKKLTATLVESDHVEEIYPTDDQIRDRIKQDLGG